jgi:hypothetical protein
LILNGLELKVTDDIFYLYTYTPTVGETIQGNL